MTDIENPIISIELVPKYGDFWVIEMKFMLPPDPTDHDNVREFKLTNENVYGKKPEMEKKLELVRKAFGIEIKMVKSSLPPKVLVNEFPQEII